MRSVLPGTMQSLVVALAKFPSVRAHNLWVMCLFISLLKVSEKIMETQTLYEELYQETVALLKDMLRDTISASCGAYDVAYNYYKSQPLFSITSKELALLKQIDHFHNYQVRNTIALLCRNLATKSGHNIIDGIQSADVDFFEISNGEKTGYYISTHNQDMPKIDEAIAEGMTKHIAVVLKTKIISLPNNSRAYRNYCHKNLTYSITLEEFFDRFVPGQFKVFQEYIGRFNYDAEIMLGFNVAPIPTKKALCEKRRKVMAEFNSFFYESEFPSEFTSEEHEFLKKRFEDCGVFEITSAPFIESFVSSEWYYDLRASTDGEMEQTAIVAGYLKSIEQFLFSLMLSRCDELTFTLKTKVGEHNWAILTRKNKDNLLSMANNLLYTIDYNYNDSLEQVYVNEVIGHNVQAFLHKFFTKTRNGYFHKDNIYSYEQIKSIRKSAYCAMFLLSSSFVFDIEQLKISI